MHIHPIRIFPKRHLIRAPGPCEPRFQAVPRYQSPRTFYKNVCSFANLEAHIKDPANSVTHAVQMERTPSRGVHSRPTGVPGVPDGFLVDIHYFRTRMNHPGHLRTLAAPLTALPALGYQPGFSRDNSMRIEPISPSCFLENPGCPLRILVDTRVPGEL